MRIITWSNPFPARAEEREEGGFQSSLLLQPPSHHRSGATISLRIRDSPSWKGQRSQRSTPHQVSLHTSPNLRMIGMGEMSWEDMNLISPYLTLSITGRVPKTI